MPRFPSAQGRLNHEPGFHLSCDENLSEGWGPPLLNLLKRSSEPSKWLHSSGLLTGMTPRNLPVSRSTSRLRIP